GLGNCNEVVDRLRGDRWVDHQDERRGASQGHTGEVFGWIYGKLAVKAWCDRQRGLAAHHQRISIGRRFSYCFRGDHAARAGPVLNQHRLTQTFRHFLGDNPGNHVGATACGKANHHLDWFVGIICGLRVAFGHRKVGDDRKRDEKHRIHSITSSARATSCGGMVSPSATSGTISFNSSSHFPPIEASRLVNPVAFPPGLAKVFTNPLPIGSDTIAKITGIVRVSLRRAAVVGVLEERITSGRHLTNSFAACSIEANSGPAQCMVIEKLTLSVQPNSLSLSQNTDTYFCASASFSR